MTRLIEITKLKMSRVSVDCTMKFVLSALWNLTDESPLACHCFLNLDGVELAISCLAVSHTTILPVSAPCWLFNKTVTKPLIGSLLIQRFSLKNVHDVSKRIGFIVKVHLFAR